MKRFILWLLVLLICQTSFAALNDRLFVNANQNFQVGNYRQAKLNLTNMEAEDKQNSDYALLMGKVCLALGEYKESYDWLMKFKQGSMGSDPIVNSELLELINDAAKYQDYAKVSMTVSMPKGNINSYDSDYAPIVTRDGKVMYFSSLRRSEFDKENIFKSELQDGVWSEPTEVNSLNTDLNECMGTILEDEKTAYLFGYYGSKKTNGDIFTSTFDKGKWSKPVLIKEVSGDYYDLQPYVFNGDTMFFTSNRDGNHDNYDIYVSELVDGSWTIPENLGPVINTNQDEQSPFLDWDGKTLYFSSKGHPGYGGDDIFRAEKIGSTWTEWSTPENLGPIINSVMDDRYYTTTSDGATAYYSSNRKDGVGLEDIFYIDLAFYNSIRDKIEASRLGKPQTEPGSVDIIINGIVVDEEDNPLTAKITWDYMQKELPQTQVIESAEDGKFSLPLNCTLQSINYNCKPRGYERAERTVDLTKIETINETVPVLFIKITCKKLDRASDEAFDIRISGRVLDEKNSPVMTNLYWYYVYDNEMNEVIVETDEEGAFKFYIPRVDQIKYVVNDPRYLPREEMQLLPAEINAYDLKIRVISVSNDVKITGKVVDKNNEPLVADLYWFYTTDEQAVEYHVVSKPDGSYVVAVQKKGKINYRVEKKNYMQVSGSMDLPLEKREYSKDFTLTKLEIDESFRLDNVQFEFNKSTLTKESYPILNPVISTMNSNPSLNIELSGHTDNIGGKEYNQKLSEARAKSVADYLISKDISKDRIMSKGYGFDVPIADNKTPDGRAKNRRTELKVTSIEFQPDETEKIVAGFENAANLPIVSKTIKADREGLKVETISSALEEQFIQKVKESAGAQKGDLTVELFISKGTVQSVKPYVKSGTFTPETLDDIATKLVGWKIESEKSFIHTLDVSLK
jgi:outer membrane protein OmpA-like peptidoglycan-associated protein